VVMSFFDVFGRNEGCCEAIEDLEIFFFQFIGYLESIYQKIFTARTLLVNAVKNLKTRCVVEVSVVVMWSEII
jgi:hypothetical protein